MTEAQQSLIKSALSIAFNAGQTFTSCEAVIEYLQETGVSESLLSAHIVEIFTCFLTLQDERRKGEVLSPPPSEGSPIRSSDESVEGDDCAHGNRIAPPVFHSQETIHISFFRPRLKNLGLAVAKICEGNISYISETVVRINHLDRDKPSIILQWHYVSVSEDKVSYTRCIVVKPELLPDCDIALGENCGKEDEEELGEEEHDVGGDEDNLNLSDESQLNDMVKYEPFGAMLTQRLSPEEEYRVIRISTAMNLETALRLTRITSPQPRPFPLTSDRLRVQSSRTTGGRNMS
jgi:hypothetical protein